MRGKRTAKVSEKGRTDWKHLRARSDRQIRQGLKDDADVRPTDAGFWKQARVVMPMAKQTITIRLDADLLEWLRKQKGYPTRINAVLQTFMEANRTPERRD